MPDVVLIAECYEVSFAKRGGMHEVATITHATLITDDPHEKGRFSGKVLDDRQRLILGTIVANDQFNGLENLTCQTLQLIRNEASAIASGHRDGE